MCDKGKSVLYLLICIYFAPVSGQEVAVFHIPRGEREGVGYGIPHQIYQGHRGASWQGGAAGGPQKWTGTLSCKSRNCDVHTCTGTLN